jgi:NAD(P)H-hydrate epimerase
MRLITSDDQKAIDRMWQERTGLPLLLLMEAAAAAVAAQCIQMAGGSPLPVLILAGKGQNGGDAFACARMLLASGWPVRCREMEPDAALPAEAAANRQALLNLGYTLGTATEDDFLAVAGGIIVDGLYGTGYRTDRPPTDAFCRLSAAVGQARRQATRVVSIDVPSGLNVDDGRAAACCITADRTVTFVRSKPGLLQPDGLAHAGAVVIDLIGVGSDLVEEALDSSPAWMGLDRDTIQAWAPLRAPDSHKGLFGKAALIGGSAGMPGAILLAGEAAARSGAGLVSLHVPQAIAGMVLAARPEALLKPIPDEGVDLAGWLASLKDARACGIGPGLGQPVWVDALLTGLIESSSGLVIDADGLNQLARAPEHYWLLFRKSRTDRQLPPAILTPHPGECRRLAPDLDPQDRLKTARLLALRSSCIVVLKGQATVVAEPSGRCWINTTGNDGLARGGSGDVLCGLITGLLAQGLESWQAAAAGVYLHGLSADLAARQISRRALLPRDVIAGLGQAYAAAGWETELLGKGKRRNRSMPAGSWEEENRTP